ncbi:MAG: hypothetical protein OM95_07990 [Bdellovibrio sp. ArHS]|uniref:hypothetical protein n=1 Tax=Bdellovibrio sp. ArHS TaxID=1569284 RepID=UPI0005826703|nr:hypothetical protein [Bdellovibrio sp. ArHS]KHD88726.1 MAG: hypothetical protein OM95_07990 [Bdellovibrio sp. ArHS]
MKKYLTLILLFIVGCVDTVKSVSGDFSSEERVCTSTVLVVGNEASGWSEFPFNQKCPSDQMNEIAEAIKRPLMKKVEAKVELGCYVNGKRTLLMSKSYEGYRKICSESAGYCRGEFRPKGLLEFQSEADLISSYCRFARLN